MAHRLVARFSRVALMPQYRFDHLGTAVNFTDRANKRVSL
jgi:hypothetical protein